MRAVILVGTGIGLLVACKMPNPAFKEDDGSDTGGTNGGDSGDGGGGTGGHTSDDGGGGTGGGTTGDQGCQLEFQPPRAVRYDVVGMTCDELLEGYFHVMVGQEGFQFQGPCTASCEECADKTALMGPVHDLAPGDITCWWVVNEEPIADATPNRCSFKAFTFWQDIQPIEVPLAIGSSLDYGVTISAREVFPEFQVNTKRVDACECIPEEGCCDPSNPPAKYELEINGGYIKEGQTVQLEAEPWFYTFTNVQSESAGLCGEPRRIGWVMSLNL